jgi:hypothetical protein
VTGWHAVLPEAVIAAALAMAYFAGRAAARRGRRRAAVPDPGPFIADGKEAHIAVGALAHIAPSDIRAHVLLVVTNDGELAVSGTVGCGNLKALILAKATAVFAEQAFAEHDHDYGHGGER